MSIKQILEWIGLYIFFVAKPVLKTGPSGYPIASFNKFQAFFYRDLCSEQCKEALKPLDKQTREFQERIVKKYFGNDFI